MVNKTEPLSTYFDVGIMPNFHENLWFFNIQRIIYDTTECKLVTDFEEI